MAMLTVAEALARILADVAPTGAEEVGLVEADGRVLACGHAARLTQPPFHASAMDGYAVRAADVAQLPARLRVVGEAAAGHPFAGSIAAGEAVRIFTGAPLPAGTDAIVIQENTAREDDAVTVREGAVDPEHVRPRGGDFSAGAELLRTGHVLTPRDLTLAAAMGHARLSVRRRPVVAILATGDELVEPGVAPGDGQIVSSNPYGLAAMACRFGAEPRLLGIAKDTRADLARCIAAAAGADVLVTVGGASVGDHDLVAPVLQEHGMALDFWKIAMRPGKPLMFGRLGVQRVIGVPGNPVSALICMRVFVVPLIARLLGRAVGPERLGKAALARAISANGPRQHYMRATLVGGDAGGAPLVDPVPSQDSSLMSPLARADCLIVRAAGAPAAAAGDAVDILPMDF
ncbi:MAG: gephyrin-like molybdotransferase Glp [Pseudomonadota bacterium]